MASSSVTPLIKPENMAKLLNSSRLSNRLQAISASQDGAVVFGYYVKDPGRYGVVRKVLGNEVLIIRTA